MIKYAVIDGENNRAIEVAFYGGAHWGVFKDEYEASHPGFLLIDITQSDFPAFQEWQYEDGVFLPKSENQMDFNYLKENVLKMIVSNTDLIRFKNNILYNGDWYSGSEISQLYYNVLKLIAPSIPLENFPLYIPKIDPFWEYLSLNSVEEVNLFCDNAMNFFITQTKMGRNEIKTVKFMDNVVDLVSYYDIRLSR